MYPNPMTWNTPMIKFNLPVYYTNTYKTKPDKTFLLSLNWFRNAYYHEQNKVKAHMEELVHNQLKDIPFSYNAYKVSYTYNYKNAASDLSNVAPMTSKWVNDYLQSAGRVANDNVKHLKEEHFYVGIQSKGNPTMEITIEEIP